MKFKRLFKPNRENGNTAQMDPLEGTNYYRKKSSRPRKEIEEQITEDRKINKNDFKYTKSKSSSE